MFLRKKAQNNFKSMDFDIEMMKRQMLDILIATDRFCNEHGIRYTLSYGTLLGAVRHGGFIPWDDDIDIVMPRPDYERFLELTKDRSIGKYKVMSPQHTPNYCWCFAKVIDTDTTLIEMPGYGICPIGTYIDIFAVDGMSESHSQYVRQVKDYNRHLEHAKYILFGNISPLHSLKRNILSVVYGLKRSLVNADRVSARYDFDSARQVKVLLDTHIDDFADRTIFDNYTTIEFEGFEFSTVVRYDELLRHWFGDDYMTPPPENKRGHWHYRYYVNLEKGLDRDTLKVMGII